MYCTINTNIKLDMEYDPIFVKIINIYLNKHNPETRKKSLKYYQQ